MLRIETFSDLLQSIPKAMSFGSYDAILHAMAVLDYLPTEAIPGKIKSGRRELVLKLAPAPKILPMFRKLAPAAFLVGFKLEVDVDKEELWSRAHKLIEHAGADLVVANLLPSDAPENHVAYLIRPDFNKRLYPPEEISGKREIAWTIVEETTTTLNS